MDASIQNAIVAASDLDTRLDWVEPMVKSLSIEETAASPGGHGNDGNIAFPECTLS